LLADWRLRATERLVACELFFLESRWREDADELHFAHWTMAHARVHAVVLRLSAREIRRDYCRPMLCRHQRSWQFRCGGKAAGTSYALHRGAVVVMTAFFWIPVMCLGRREPEGTSYSYTEQSDGRPVQPINSITSIYQRRTPLMRECTATLGGS